MPVALAASGASFGFRASLPFLVGVVVGLALVLTATRYGFAAVLGLHPLVKTTLYCLSAIYLLYIAHKIAFASAELEHSKLNAPGFYDGVIFNVINPKAYAAMLSLLSQFAIYNQTDTSYWLLLALIWLVGCAVDLIWLLSGGMLKPIFAQPRQQQLIRYTFGLSLVMITVYGGIVILNMNY